MNYQIEQYLIEEYIQKVENCEHNNSNVNDVSHNKHVKYDILYTDNITAL